MKKQKEKDSSQRKTSLKAKMLLYFLVSLIAVFAISGIVIITSMSSIVVTLNNDLTEQVVLGRADEIGKYIDGLIYEVKTMSERSIISSGDITKIKSDIESRQSSYRSDYEMVLYSDMKGNFYSSLGTTGSIADRAYFQEIASGGKDYAISNPVDSKITGKKIFVVAYAVKNSAGQNVGVFGATILLDTFNNVINDIKIGDAGYPWITDSTGLIIAHPSDSIRLKLNAVEGTGFTGLDAVGNRMVSGEKGIQAYKNSSGEQYFAVFAPIPSTPGWSMAYSLSNTDMMASVNSLTLTIIMILIGSVLLFAVLTYIITNSIVKPIKATSDLASALASGDLDHAITIKSNDEIGQMAGVLDKDVRQAFKNIEEARIISDKQAKYQSAEVDKLVVNLERLSAGELYCDMSVANADADTQGLYELFSRISENMHLTVDTLKSYISEISDTLGAMSAGDMSINIDSEYRGEFVALKDSINSIVKSLSNVLSEINTASDQVAAGTKQVSEGSQVISQGATEQAASIEELSASIMQIAEQISQSTINTNKAKDLSESAQKQSATGDEQMKALQKAMVELNESSENISKIIKVIDDIAFQTNILALNAAVEAARAGVHGKGFAVVAEEVRNLAAKSAGAAKETAELIENSIKKVEEGTRLTDVTGKALTSILEGAVESARFMAEIATASEQQSAGIQQINSGIEQLSVVVQSNSATAEETAAASEELSSQADLLKSMVGQFKLMEHEVQRVQPEKAHAVQKPKEKAKIVLSENDFGKY